MYTLLALLFVTAILSLCSLAARKWGDVKDYAADHHLIAKARPSQPQAFYNAFADHRQPVRSSRMTQSQRLRVIA